MADDLYAVLGVKRDASDREIRQAYRRLARQWHPDVNPGSDEAESHFKQINAAHEVLSDPDKRRKYDQYGDQWQHADQIEQMRRRQGAAGGFAYQGAEGVDLGDLFGGGGGGGRGGGGMFDSLFRRAGGRQRGRDLETGLRLTLEEAYSGINRTIEVRGGAEPCRACSGSGQIAGATCHACRGQGAVTTPRRLEVTIPAGVTDGQRIRIAGKGGSGGNGGAPGDLLIRVEVIPHPRFERRGDDLHVEVDLPVADGALGGEVRVPTLKGKALALRVPGGTQGGRIFRLAGQGMPRRAGGFGDLFAKVRLVLPEPMSDEQRALFERLREVSRDASTGSTAEPATETAEAAGAAGARSGEQTEAAS
ncbi:MAG: J domain-containing protein [Chloroflexi bacterium]|nr:J domain-containing protein [Chloroflexota bacterium]MDA1241319.1 J domain-containing protein [Chloroflexota bacterium]MQC19477.1 J domain-containing protein [Chloroflexota bacterium]